MAETTASGKMLNPPLHPTFPLSPMDKTIITPSPQNGNNNINKYSRSTLWNLLCYCSVVSDSLATPWTVAHQAPLSVGFPGQEYWKRLPFPSPGDLPDTAIEPVSPSLAGRFFTSEPPGNPHTMKDCSFIFKVEILMHNCTTTDGLLRCCQW